MHRRTGEEFRIVRKERLRDEVVYDDRIVERSFTGADVEFHELVYRVVVSERLRLVVVERVHERRDSDLVVVGEVADRELVDSLDVVDALYFFLLREEDYPVPGDDYRLVRYRFFSHGERIQEECRHSSNRRVRVSVRVLDSVLLEHDEPVESRHESYDVGLADYLVGTASRPVVAVVLGRSLDWPGDVEDVRIRESTGYPGEVSEIRPESRSGSCGVRGDCRKRRSVVDVRDVLGEYHRVLTVRQDARPLVVREISDVDVRVVREVHGAEFGVRADVQFPVVRRYSPDAFAGRRFDYRAESLAWHGHSVFDSDVPQIRRVLPGHPVVAVVRAEALREVVVYECHVS